MSDRRPTSMCHLLQIGLIRKMKSDDTDVADHHIIIKQYQLHKLNSEWKELNRAKLLLEILENATNATFVKCHTPSQNRHFYLIATKKFFYSEIFSIPDLHECKPRAQIKPWGNDSTCIQFISLGEETG